MPLSFSRWGVDAASLPGDLDVLLGRGLFDSSDVALFLPPVLAMSSLSSSSGGYQYLVVENCLRTQALLARENNEETTK